MSTIRTIVENAYVRSSMGSAMVQLSQREAVIEQFREEIESDVFLIEAIIAHEASARATVLAPDEPVLVLGDV